MLAPMAAFWLCQLGNYNGHLEKYPFRAACKSDSKNLSEFERGSGWMGQLGFFDLNRRYEGLDVKNDPLVAIAAMVPFESFRPKLKAALIKGELRSERSGTQEFGGTQALG